MVTEPVFGQDPSVFLMLLIDWWYSANLYSLFRVKKQFNLFTFLPVLFGFFLLHSLHVTATSRLLLHHLCHVVQLVPAETETEVTKQDRETGLLRQLRMSDAALFLHHVSLQRTRFQPHACKHMQTHTHAWDWCLSVWITASLSDVLACAAGDSDDLWHTCTAHTSAGTVVHPPASLLKCIEIQLNPVFAFFLLPLLSAAVFNN